ncbi:Cupredoxin [Annulohypoxylon maeteangense]|uniref:Cupredoxin n=1 Tax=Annulohypoxylon maeteangense TaxID=1927788 RepID=UPI00200840B7|nr:Cupredoxin [Annulohypoxylon maeteangense]KAI0882504.1 Cupredoxin [Annulohypoxylon maeteangense]
MKYSAALSVAIAPLAIAKAVHNVYPQHKRTSHKSELGAVAGSAQGIEVLQGVQLGSSTQVIVIWANPGNNAATTTLHEQVTVTQTVTAAAGTTAAATSAAAGAAATHTVIVGGSAGLVYTPDQITANVGDMVIFEFMSANHTATQSTFATPCKIMEGGMDSGFQANANNTVNPPPKVAMQVMTTEPLWFYCRQSGHCGKGMTFSINPSAAKTQAMFQAMAIQQNGTGAGSAITGNSTAIASSAVAAAPAATSAAAASGSINQGSGVIEGGACVCAVTCSSGSFPAVAAQGIGAFGGIAGALPASMMESV